MFLIVGVFFNKWYQSLRLHLQVTSKEEMIKKGTRKFKMGGELRCANLALGGYESTEFFVGRCQKKKKKNQCDFNLICSFHARI